MKSTMLFVVLAALAAAQDPGPRGGFRSPLFAALDTDRDGVISAAEMENAPAALKALDKNGDGKITMDEVRPNFGPGGPGGSPEEMVKRFMEFDRNGDGKLTRDEVPERMHGIFARGDKNGDGVLDRDELTAMAQAGPRGGGPGAPDGRPPERDRIQARGEGRPDGPGGFGPGPGGPGRMRMDPIFAALDTDGDSELSAMEIANAPAALKTLDRNKDGKLTADELRPNLDRNQAGPQRDR